MNAIVKLLSAALLFVCAGFACAAPTPVEGEELKKLIVTEKGTTWTLSNPTQTRITFLPDGRMYACNNGISNCDAGTYIVQEDAVAIKMESWYAQTSGQRKVTFKKEGQNLLLSDIVVSLRSEVPTLMPPETQWKPASVTLVFGGRAEDVYTETPSVKLKQYMSNLVSAGELSTERIAQRTAASRAVMAQEKITIRYTSKMVGVQEAGMKNVTEASTEFEVFPKNQEFIFYRVLSLCTKGSVKAVFAIDSQGFLIMQPVTRFNDCEKFQYVFDTLSRKGIVTSVQNGQLLLGEARVELLK